MTLQNRTASSVLHGHPGNNYTYGDVVAHALKPNKYLYSKYAIEIGEYAVVVYYPWGKFNLSPEEYECIVAELRVKGETMSYVQGSSDIRRYSRRRRAQALNFSDRQLFPIWWAMTRNYDGAIRNAAVSYCS